MPLTSALSSLDRLTHGHLTIAHLARDMLTCHIRRVREDTTVQAISGAVAACSVIVPVVVCCEQVAIVGETIGLLDRYGAAECTGARRHPCRHVVRLTWVH